MSSPTYQKLKELIEHFETYKMAKSYLDQLLIEREFYLVKLNSLNAYIDETQDRIDRKENSLMNVFKKLLINSNSKLESEMGLKTILKYNECVDVLALIDFEIEVVREKIKDYSIIKKKIKELRKKHLKEFDKEFPAIKRKILLLNARHYKNLGMVKEIKEAISSANKAEKNLNQIITHLKNSANYEVWGNIIKPKKGGPIIKKNNIEKAFKLLPRTQMSINKFNKELMDVYHYFNTYYAEENFNGDKFVEMFNDNLITDWVLQKHVFNVLKFAIMIRSNLQRQKKSLNQDLRKYVVVIKKYDKNVHEIINSVK